MIQVYLPENSNYDFNGDYELHPISCILTMQLNGDWSVEMEHPIDECFEYIVNNAVLSIDTSYGDAQLFRIYDTDKRDSSILAYARPIFLDAAHDCFLFDVRPTDRTGKQALDIMTSGSKYKGNSDILTINTAYYVHKNLIEAISGDDENSFINRWGGEVFYKNYFIYINHEVGHDRGMRAEFGFNLAGISERINTDNIVTRIVPKAYNGYTLDNNATVDSENIGKYPIIYTRVIEYPDVKLKEDATGDEQGFETLAELQHELIKRAKAEYENGIDKPTISYDVDMVDISKTDLYREYETLMQVTLGDTIHCFHRKLGIETNARAIMIKYNCITKSVDQLTLGDYTKDYFSDISSVFNTAKEIMNPSNNTVYADKVFGIINAMNAQMKYQKDVAKKQDVRAILFEDLDKNSPTYGASCWGSLGFQIANKRTPDNSDWQWSTFANADGIVSGTIAAGLLIGMQIQGGSININDLFMVDSGGNLTMKKGSINLANNFIVDTGGNLTMKKGYINLADNFIVDSGGNLTMKKGTINLANNFIVDSNGDATINQGTFKGNLSTDKDADVGGNLYIGKQSEYGKMVYFNSDTYIGVYMDATNYPSMSIKMRGITINFDTNGIKFIGSKGTFDISPNSSTNLNELRVANDITCDGGLTVKGHISAESLYVYGSKKRVVETDTGYIGMNAVESADAVFEDYGSGIMDETGNCIVELDHVWLETVNTEYPYFVFLTPLAMGVLFCADKGKRSFTVKGTPGMEFDWRITAKQRGYENDRLEVHAGGYR